MIWAGLESKHDGTVTE